MNDDLISRSALRKAVNDFYDNSFKGIVSSDLIKYAKAVDDFIDNAPTIDSLDLDVRIGGRCCGKRQRLLDELRPKDEWKCFIGSAYYGVDEDNEPIWKERKIYHCPFCNRRTVIKENFCPNCGADMRGDV